MCMASVKIKCSSVHRRTAPWSSQRQPAAAGIKGRKGCPPAAPVDQRLLILPPTCAASACTRERSQGGRPAQRQRSGSRRPEGKMKMSTIGIHANARKRVKPAYTAAGIATHLLVYITTHIQYANNPLPPPIHTPACRWVRTSPGRCVRRGTPTAAGWCGRASDQAPGSRPPQSRQTAGCGGAFEHECVKNRFAKAINSMRDR